MSVTPFKIGEKPAYIKYKPHASDLDQRCSDRPALTPASLFETKYDWLMRWAMHFAQNDRTAAEDLVQDAFVRLMSSWPRIKDNIADVEPVLYSYLRYSYLTEIRRGRFFRFTGLALIVRLSRNLGMRDWCSHSDALFSAMAAGAGRGVSFGRSRRAGSRSKDQQKHVANRRADLLGAPEMVV